MKKRILSIVLALVMVLSIVSVTANAADDDIPAALSVLSGNTSLPVRELTSTVAESELSSGIYYLTQSLTLNSDKSKDNGLIIADNATVYLYIPADITLTVYGKDGTDAGAATAAVSATLKLVDNTFSHTTSGNTATAVGKRVAPDTYSEAGKGGKAATGGKAAIYVPTSANFCVFGAGSLIAVGGKGGNGTEGKAGAVAAHGATTMVMNNNSTNTGKGHYWMVDVNHSGAKEVSVDTSPTWSSTYHYKFYNALDTMIATIANGGSGGVGGGGAGGGAGGGGAAIGTDGSDGTDGTDGALKTGTPYNALAASDPAAPEDAEQAGNIYITGVATDLTGGVGGTGYTGTVNSTPSAVAVKEYKRWRYTSTAGTPTTDSYSDYAADAQSGGNGGAGGAGAAIGTGGTGGAGGQGGNSGVVRHNPNPVPAGPKPGYSSKKGADGVAQSNALNESNMPYYTVTFTGVDTSEKYYFGQGTTITVPANSDDGFVGWELKTPAVKTTLLADDGNTALLSGDSAIYEANAAITMNTSAVGNIVLEPVYRHTHSFTYMANGATITATCTEGCDEELDKNPESLTLTEELIAMDVFSVEGLTGWPFDSATGAIPLSGVVPVINYYKADDLAAPLAGKPTEPGSYKVTLTFGDAAAELAFTIEAAPQNKASVTLSDAIVTNFKLDLATYAENAGAEVGALTVKATYNTNSNVNYDKNYQTQNVTGQLVEKDGRYCFSVAQAPAQIAEPITVKIYNGEELLDSLECSGKQYADAFMSKTADELGVSEEQLSKFKAVCIAMVNYSDRAQKYFKCGETVITEEDGTTYNCELPAAVNGAKLSVNGTDIKVKSLSFMSLAKSALRIYYEGDITAEDVTCSDDEKTVTVNTDKKYIEVAGFVAAELNDVFTITVKDTTITANVLAYTKLGMASSDTAIQALCASIVLYNTAANAAFSA